MPSKTSYSLKPSLASCYRFKIKGNTFSFPVGEGRTFGILLTQHTLRVLSDTNLMVRSFVLTSSTISLCIFRGVPIVECIDKAGVDRNLRNLTLGNEQRITQYDLSKAAKVAATTRSIISSFERNDARIRKKIASKYGRRRRDRTNHLLQNVTKRIVEQAERRREVLVLENLTGMRNRFLRREGGTRASRGAMNSWKFHEAQRQLEYKAAWQTRELTVLVWPSTASRSEEERDSAQADGLWGDLSLRSG